MIAPDQLHAFAPACDAASVARALEAAALEAGCTTPLLLCHFLSQGDIESRGFTRLVESLNYAPEKLIEQWPTHFTLSQAQLYGRTSGHPANQEAIANLAYGGRLGNKDPGDGWRYRGRGYVQLTGRKNYADAGEALGLDLEGDPAQVATPAVAARVFAWFWRAKDINAAAARNDIEAVTRKVNGGLTGLAQRRASFIRARAIWR